RGRARLLIGDGPPPDPVLRGQDVVLLVVGVVFLHAELVAVEVVALRAEPVGHQVVDDAVVEGVGVVDEVPAGRRRVVRVEERRPVLHELVDRRVHAGEEPRRVTLAGELPASEAEGTAGDRSGRRVRSGRRHRGRDGRRRRLASSPASGGEHERQGHGRAANESTTSNHHVLPGGTALQPSRTAAAPPVAKPGAPERIFGPPAKLRDVSRQGGGPTRAPPPAGGSYPGGTRVWRLFTGARSLGD